MVPLGRARTERSPEQRQLVRVGSGTVVRGVTLVWCELGYGCVYVYVCVCVSPRVCMLCTPIFVLLRWALMADDRQDSLTSTRKLLVPALVIMRSSEMQNQHSVRQTVRRSGVLGRRGSTAVRPGFQSEEYHSKWI